MTKLIFSIIPFGIGAAISPTLLIITVIALASPSRRLLSGWAVVLGSGLAALFYAVLGFLIGSTIHHKTHRNIDFVIDICVAVLLFILASRQWLRRNKATGKPTIADRLAKTSPRDFFVVGMIGMLCNATSIVLFIPAIHLITKSNAGVTARAAATLVMVLFLLLPVLIPVVIASLFGRHADGVLSKLHTYVTDYTVQITAAVELLFGAYFLIKAIVEVSS